MVAAQLFNQRNGESNESIYGAVITGRDWKFLKLIDKTIWIDKRGYVYQWSKSDFVNFNKTVESISFYRRSEWLTLVGALRWI